MNESGQTIALCMIVKNEHHVLRRCLASVRPLIDTWVIVDTGSTDGTQALIREIFADLPGDLYERPWVNFGHNRTESLQLARDKADYLLIIDADEELQIDPGFRLPRLTMEAYAFLMHTASIDYHRIHLIKTGLPWRYEGVMHEYVTCDRTHTQELMPGVKTIVHPEGARARDPLTYRKDALLLEEAMLKDPENARNMFYLAQSYRDAREPELAVERYRRRLAMPGWVEETWYTAYQIAAILEGKGEPWSAVEVAYLEAYAMRPTRAEPLYRVGMHYQAARQHAVALLFFAAAVQIPSPDDLLFVEREVYRFFLPLEYAVACYWTGRHTEAIAVTDRLLADTSLSEERVEHLRRNRQFSMDALAQSGVAIAQPSS